LLVAGCWLLVAGCWSRKHFAKNAKAAGQVCRDGFVVRTAARLLVTPSGEVRRLYATGERQRKPMMTGI
jgi:hypothetical protein